MKALIGNLIDDARDDDFLKMLLPLLLLNELSNTLLFLSMVLFLLLVLLVFVFLSPLLLIPPRPTTTKELFIPFSDQLNSLLNLSISSLLLDFLMALFSLFAIV